MTAAELFLASAFDALHGLYNLDTFSTGAIRIPIKARAT
jgi:hypothetical protein